VDRHAAGTRLDVFLAAHISEVSRSQLSRHIAAGAVTVDGARGQPSRKVRADEVVEWIPPPVAPAGIVAEAMPMTVAYEDRWLIVINKPAGLVVHPAAGHETGTLVNALLAHCTDLQGVGGERRPGIVHRLDKDTSGLLVVAKDDATLNALGADFKVHRITRVYDALAVGRPSGTEGRIDTLHGRDPRDRKKFSILVKAGRRAVTNWRLMEALEGAARVAATLETGRTHQVRVHFAAMGCPLLGDAVYGKPPRDSRIRDIGRALGRQALHARRLGFQHPATGQRIDLEAEPPEDFQRALAALRRLGRA